MALPILVVTIEVRIGEINGSAYISIPQAHLERAMPKILKAQAANNKAKTTSSKVIEKSLSNVKLDCTAILGRATVTMKDIIGIQCGDVIRLDSSQAHEVEFWVGDRLFATGTPGQCGRKVGIKLNKIVANELIAENAA